jgi:hypothetical protein
MNIRPSSLLSVALVAAALLATAGCISTHETVYADNAPRTKIAFASDKAASTFYEALSRSPESRQRTEKHTSVNLILIDVEQRTVAGPNQTFNEAVAFCDTNRDGVITEAEADIFAAAWPKSRD